MISILFNSIFNNSHYFYISLIFIARHTNPICNFDYLREKSLSRDHQKARITDKRRTVIDFTGISEQRLTPVRRRY